MTSIMLAKGTKAYNISKDSVVVEGLTWSKTELDSALPNEISDILFDKKGQDELDELLNNFSKDHEPNLNVSKLVLNVSPPTQELYFWMIGEAIAISYLEVHKHCLFPWPTVRDKRTPNASLPGADLVGFYSDSNIDCFLFGEVKTSGEPNSPPGVMSGKKGMTQQLLTLNNSVDIREQLISYLAFRSNNEKWKGKLHNALSRYQANNTDFKLYGVLIRDIEPNSKDLESCQKKLISSCPPSTKVELLGLYLPISCLKTLVSQFKNP